MSGSEKLLEYLYKKERMKNKTKPLMIHHLALFLAKVSKVSLDAILIGSDS